MKERCEIDLSPGTRAVPARAGDLRAVAGFGAAAWDMVFSKWDAGGPARFVMLRRSRITLDGNGHPLARAFECKLLRCRLLALTALKTAVKGTTLLLTRPPVAKAELGTKRIDPETGRKFYDLNKDPIVSPYTGKSYPRSYFEEGKGSSVEEEDEVEEKEVDSEEEGAEIVSLEEADDEAKGGDDLPDLGDDDDDVELDDDDDDTFLEDEEEENDDVSDMIGVGDDDDEV
jgi:uncharacterized protein (TIGR02300 family)